MRSDLNDSCGTGLHESICLFLVARADFAFEVASFTILVTEDLVFGSTFFVAVVVAWLIGHRETASDDPHFGDKQHVYFCPLTPAWMQQQLVT